MTEPSTGPVGQGSRPAVPRPVQGLAATVIRHHDALRDS
jgi:hypothetical protein